MDKIERILTRGVANIIPGKDELTNVLASKKELNVYLGIDPTAPRIHLGHAVPLIKLQKFAEMGHNVTLVIGDFTALVGDTSDKEGERPILTSSQIEENFKTYKAQAERILDFSRIEVRHNSEWLAPLTYSDVFKLKQQFTLNDFISRELIKKRLNEGKTVRLDETEYPIMQGYDSYHLDTDIQIGGADQTFNMQAGRTLQKKLRGKESYVLATEFLMGTDGRKMSKSWGNAIWLDDSPEEMFGKIMSIDDNVIIQYFTLVTRVSNEEIEQYEERLKSENPRDIKKILAETVVSELFSPDEAEPSKEYFERTVQQKELPDEMEEIEVRADDHVSIAQFLEKAGLATSISDAKRLIEQGGVTIDGNPVANVNEDLIPQDNMVIKVGKRRYAKIRIN